MSAYTESSVNPQRAINAIAAASLRTRQQHGRQNKIKDGSAAGRLKFFNRIIASTAWPRRPRRGVINGLPQHRMRARTIDCDGHRSIRGSFTSSRHGYGKVYFESALERSVLFKLDRMPESVSWYMEQPLAIPYIDHHGRARKHYPDVLIATPAGEVILVECKPVPHMIQLDTFEKGIVAIAHAVARGWGYVICDDRGITPAILATQPPHAREQELSPPSGAAAT